MKQTIHNMGNVQYKPISNAVAIFYFSFELLNPTSLNLNFLKIQNRFPSSLSRQKFKCW